MSIPGCEDVLVCDADFFPCQKTDASDQSSAEDDDGPMEGPTSPELADQDPTSFRVSMSDEKPETLNERPEDPLFLVGQEIDSHPVSDVDSWEEVQGITLGNSPLENPHGHIERPLEVAEGSNSFDSNRKYDYSQHSRVSAGATNKPTNKQHGTSTTKTPTRNRYASMATDHGYTPMLLRSSSRKKAPKISPTTTKHLKDQKEDLSCEFPLHH